MSKGSFLPSLRRHRKRSAAPRARAAAHVDVRRALLAVSTIAAMSLLTSVHFLPDRVGLQVGDRSPTEIRAPRSVTFVDEEATERLRASAAAQVGTAYDADPTALAQAARSVSDLFSRVEHVRADSSLPTASKRVEKLTAVSGALLKPEQLRYLVQLPSDALQKLRSTATALIEDTMAQDIRRGTEDLAHAQIGYERAARTAVTSPVEFGILQSIGSVALRPNRLDNRRRTEQLREARRRSVQPITDDIRSNDVIIRRGEVFTQLHLDKCRALGLINPSVPPATLAAIGALASLMVFIVAAFIHRRLPDLYKDTRRLWLLAMLMVGSIFGMRLFGNLLGVPLTVVQFGHLGVMMVVLAGMLVSALLDISLGTLVTSLLAIQCGLIMNHEIRFAVMSLMSGLVGIHAMTSSRQRIQLPRATAAIAATNVALVWVLGGLLGDTMREVVTGTAWAGAAAAFAIVLFWFGLAVLEKPFGILTDVWLLELSASEHPLLRELCLTAPGTYAHSIMVGNLAEGAAESVGANALFCRVAAYYHDAGKVRRPHCFVENQRADNIHDRLNPSLSALVVAAHVRDGLELAEQHRLPTQLRDVIREHHGTGLIRYFYHQALAESAGAPADPVLEQHFRYDGPRPQSRESGIIMLADCVEAAARCLDRPSPGAIQNLVNQIIQDKLADGQLDECDLTLRDLRTVENAFVRILGAMLHARVDYPELPSVPGDVSADTAVAVEVLHAGPDQQQSGQARADGPHPPGGPGSPAD